MRIDAYNQIAQVYKTTSAAKLQKTENARHGRDEVQISSFGRDYQIAKQAVTEAAESELEQIRLNQKKLEGMKKLIIQENERRKEEALKAKAKRKRQ